MTSAKYLILAVLFLPAVVSAQFPGGGNIGLLNPFTSTTTPESSITQRIWGQAIKLTGLESLDCIGTDADGILQLGTCSGGSGSTLHIDGGAFIYPYQGNYHSAPRYVATSTSEDSTFVRFTATNGTSTNSTSTNLTVTGAFNFLGTVITNVSTWFNGLFDTQFATKSTTNLSEGTNLYYTEARVQNELLDGNNAIFGNSSSSNSTTSVSQYFPFLANPAGTFVAIDPAGKLIATSTPSGSGTGDVTAASSFGTDNLLIRSDGTGKGVQASGITVTDGASGQLQWASGFALYDGGIGAGANFVGVNGSIVEFFQGTSQYNFNGGGGYGILDFSGLSTDRVFTFPDAAGTVALTSSFTAGDALTLTGTDFDFDGGASPQGELGGTWASPTIDDSLTVTGWNLGNSSSSAFAITGLGTPAGAFLAVNPEGSVIATTTPSGSGTPGGSDTQLQFNDGGSFGGVDGSAWNKTNKALSYSFINDNSSFGLYVANGAETTYSDLSMSGGDITFTGSGSVSFSNEGSQLYNFLGNGVNLIIDASGVNTTNKTLTAPNESGTIALTSYLDWNLESDGTLDTASTSATVTAHNFTASSSATSTLPNLSVTGAISLLGEYFTNFTTYVRSLFTGGTGITLTNGDISFDCSEVEGTGINCVGEAITLDTTGLITTSSVLDDLAQTSLADPGSDQLTFWDDSDTAFEFITSLAGLAISGNTLTVNDVTCTGCLTTTEITGLDISDDTNLAAGRSLTLSGDSVEADAELFTHTKSFMISNNGNPITATTTVAQTIFPSAVTITRISCSTDVGTATIQADERAEATPNTGGTDVMSSALACDNNTEATTSFANAGIAGDVPLNFDLDSVASSPTRVRVHIDFTYDD